MTKLEKAVDRYIQSKNEQPELEECFIAGAKWLERRLRKVTKECCKECEELMDTHLVAALGKVRK